MSYSGNRTHAERDMKGAWRQATGETKRRWGVAYRAGVSIARHGLRVLRGVHV